MSIRKYRKQFKILRYWEREGGISSYLIKNCPQCKFKAKGKYSIKTFNLENYQEN